MGPKCGGGQMVVNAGKAAEQKLRAISQCSGVGRLSQLVGEWADG